MRDNEKMTISWERCHERPATEEEVKREHEENAEYFAHTGRYPSWVPERVGDVFEVTETIELPGKYEVCGRCNGKGTHVNPSIDGNGITSDEWNGPDWSEEDKENYMSGFYDVSCFECHGKRVVLTVDEDRCDKALMKAYYEYLHDKAQDEYNDRRTMWAEDGYRGSFNDY